MGNQAFAAAAGDAVVERRGALAHSVLGERQDEFFGRRQLLDSGLGENDLAAIGWRDGGDIAINRLFCNVFNFFFDRLIALSPPQGDGARGNHERSHDLGGEGDPHLDRPALRADGGLRLPVFIPVARVFAVVEIDSVVENAGGVDPKMEGRYAIGAAANVDGDAIGGDHAIAAGETRQDWCQLLGAFDADI